MQKSLDTKLRGINNFSNYRNQLLFKPSYTLYGESLEEPGNCIIDETHYIEFNFREGGGGGGNCTAVPRGTKSTNSACIAFIFSNV